MLTFLAAISMLGSNFIVYAPLVITAFIETAEPAKVFLEKNPNFPILSMLKDYFNKGVQFKGQFLELRSDL